MSIMTEARRRVRWALQHGLIKVTMRRGIKAGELGARLLFDRDLIEDPYPAYETLRARARLVPNGVVLLAHDHDLCTAVLRSPDFRVVGGMTGPAPGPLRPLARFAGPGPASLIEPPSMIAVNPPDHTRLRKLVSRAFTARAIAALRDRTEEIATDLLDAMAARGPAGDLILDYASLLPATVITEMLGAPVSMRRQFLIWGAGGAAALDAGIGYHEFRSSEYDLLAMQNWMRGHFDEIRRNPGPNILSTLVNARDEGAALTDDELASISVLLLAAGFETTVNLIGNAVVLLTDHPEQLALLRAEPQRWPNAVDEVLRFDPPVQRTARIAQRDTVAAGERIAAGSLIVTTLAAANRDPAVFTDPQRFDITRENAGSHVTFSSGIHYCLGAGLAKMEAEVGLHALFDRFPDLSLSAAPHRRPTRALRGFDAMPVRLTARSPVTPEA